MRASINVTGWTPIHFAAFYKQGEAIKELVGFGAKINVRDDEGDTPLVLAVRNGADTALIDLMVEVGADLNKGATSSLQTAASLGNEDLVQHLLSLGANPKESTNKNVAGPLWSAVGSGNIAIVKMLLRAGAEVNSELAKENALDAAAMDGNLEMVHILLDAGAGSNHKDAQGQAPLMSAVFSKKSQVVQTLLAAGADVNAKSTDERTALDRAEREKLLDIISVLKQAGAKRGSEILKSIGKKESETL